MSHFISLLTASQMTADFRQNREIILNSSYQNLNILPVCETFDRTQLETLLAQSGCTAARIYYGMDESLNVHAILVGVNEQDEDIIRTGNQSILSTEEDLLLQGGVRCPEICPPASALNS